MKPQSETIGSPQDSAWHKQPTVWLVLGILAFTIVSSVVLLYLAATNPPELIDRNAPPTVTVDEPAVRNSP
jgi:hypothetical protein